MNSLEIYNVNEEDDFVVFGGTEDMSLRRASVVS